MTATPIALWVIPVADLGGVARHALDVAGAGIPGWRTVFLLPHGPLADRLRERGAAVLGDSVGPEHGTRASVAAAHRVVTRLRPKLIHTHLSYADVVGAAVKPRKGVALVTTEHGIADNDLVYHGSRGRSRAKAQLHRARLHRTDAFIAVSRATLEVARRKWHLPARLPAYVVPNGIDRPDEPARGGPGLHVVSLARLASEKRVPELVNAFSILAEGHPEARLTLAGVGPLEGALREQVANIGLTDRVAFPGYVDAGALLAEADVLAQLSVFENCSYALLDALVRGVGVVASPVGGNPEILSSGLVSPDDPAEVATKIVEQGLVPARRPKIPAEWPSVETMTRQVGAIYDGATELREQR